MAPPSRQERLQMRQRGAGARKVNNVDFGFSFGLTPGRVQPSGRKTPQSSNASARRPSKTPSQSRRQSSARRSMRSVSLASNTGGAEPIEPVGLLDDKDTQVEEPAAKRRKTKDGQIPESQTRTDHEPSLFSSAFVSSTVPPRKTSGPAFVQIAEDPENEIASEQLAQHGVVAKGPIQPFLGSENGNIIIDKENIVPDEHGSKDSFVMNGEPKRKPKKRRSIGQQSGRRKKRPSNESVQIIAEEPSQDSTPESVNEETEWETMIDEEFGSLPLDISEPTTEMKAGDKKRRKRKSIVLKPRKRKRSGEFSTESVVGPAELLQDEEANVRDTIKQVALAEPTRRSQYEIATQRRVSDKPVYEPELEGDETYIDEAVSPKKPTPKARSKKTKAKVRSGHWSGSNLQSNPSQNADACSRMRKSSRPTFPILTQHMTNISALPNIEEDVEDGLGAMTEPCWTETKFPERSAPNAIDVLAQICRETISAMISKLSTTSSTIAGTRGVKRKRTAIEAFGSEIDSRLFEMSVAIEHRLTIEARVKKAKKAKIDAQNEWMELRRQREEIALKCDDIRARNQTMEAEGKETYELSEQLHELEMLIEKPELDDERGVGDGLEYMLRSVSMTVSSDAGAGNGLLAQVKDYNRQLERTALLLEGRELD